MTTSSLSSDSPLVPSTILDMLALADVSWRAVLLEGLQAIARADPAYLPALANDAYLPTQGRLFAAFAQPLPAVRYVLVGEGPYPREQSATGVCFMDGAVGSLWSEHGLSKQVNRATSLRNFMKMLLLAQENLIPAQAAQQAHMPQSRFIQTLAELQQNLLRQGFLLLNATLVYRAHVAPVKEAKAWRPFLHTVLQALSNRAALLNPCLTKPDSTNPTLILWGKIAEQLNSFPAVAALPKAIAEHPYNLSFIENKAMQALFGPMNLLLKNAA